MHEPWYQRRVDWQARPDNGIGLLELPVSIVAIGHSVTSFCTERFSCIKEVLKIQADHQSRGWHDIGPNFLVGGNGFVFEGRGANVVGAMVGSWNHKIISIMFLGNFLVDYPTQDQFDNVDVLLKELMKKGVLAPDYALVGHCQLVSDIITPGPHLMDNLHNFEHWDPANTTGCLRLQ